VVNLLKTEKDKYDAGQHRDALRKVKATVAVIKEEATAALVSATMFLTPIVDSNSTKSSALRGNDTRHGMPHVNANLLTSVWFVVAVIVLADVCQAQPFGNRPPTAVPEPKATLGLPDTIRRIEELNNFTVAFSPDGATVASASRWLHPETKKSSGRIHLWDVETGQHRRTIPDCIGVAFGPDRQRPLLATANANGTVSLLDLANDDRRILIDGRGDFIAFSPDARVLATTSTRGTTLWDTTNGRLVGRFPLEGVGAVSFKSDGRILGAAGPGGKLTFWDVRRADQILRSIEAHREPVLSFAFSPAGGYFASATFGDRQSSGEIVIRGRETVRALQGHVGAVRAIAFSPDGKILAAAGGRLGVADVRGDLWAKPGQITLWDTASGRQIATLTGHKGFVFSVAFSPDGKTLASGSFDRTIKLWDVNFDQPPTTPQQRISLTVKDAQQPQLLIDDANFAIARMVLEGRVRRPVPIDVKPERDGRGNYRFSLAPGGYRVTVKADGYESRDKPISVRNRPQETVILLKRVAPPPERDVVITLKDEKQKDLLVKGAEISIVGVDVKSKPDGKGRYTISLRPDEYRFVIMKKGYEPKYTTITVGDKAISNTVFLKPIVGPKPDRSLILAVYANDQLRRGRRIPIDDAKISFKPDLAKLVKGENGFYVFNLKPGTYKVSVARGGYKTTAPVTVKVEDNVTSPTEIILEALTYVLKVRVLDDRKRPIAGLKVDAEVPPLESDNPEGQSSYAVRLTSGTYELIAETDRLDFEPQRVTIESSPRELQLEPRQESTTDDRLTRLFDRLNTNKDRVLNEDDFLGSGWEDITLRLDKVGAIDLVPEDLRPLLASTKDPDVKPDQPAPIQREPTIAQQLERLKDRLDTNDDDALNKEDFLGTGWEDITLRLNKVGAIDLVAEDLRPLLESKNDPEVESDPPPADQQELTTAEQLERLKDRLDTNDDDALNKEDFLGTGWEDITLRLNKVGAIDLVAEDLRPLLPSTVEPPQVDTKERPALVGTLTIRRVADKESSPVRKTPR
jgi:dipeptidyl aminopeptidase/acylaminoacyl peptidase